MLRKLALGASALALAVGGLAVAATNATAAPKPPPFAAHGNVSCSLTKGVIKIKPGLTNTPTVQTTTIKISTVCSGSTGNPAVTMKSSKFTGSLNDPNPSTCASLAGTHNTPVDLHAKWKANGGKIFESDIHFTSYAGSSSFTVPGPGGTSSIATGGSFAGEHANGSGSIAAIKGDCSAKHPIKTITLGSGTVTIQP